MSGYIGNIPVPQATQTRQSFTATASQTTFATAGYTAGFIDVFLNGIKLVDGTDYTATNGSDVVLTTGAAVSDVLDVVMYAPFDVVNTSLTDATINNTLTLKNATEEDTDGGRESTIIFKGEQSGGEISTLAEIEASHDGTADDEKGDLIFRTNDGADGSAPTERLRIDSNGAFLVGTDDRQIYYNSVNVYNASAVIKTNVTNEVADLVITNGNNNFGSAVEFARTNSAGNDVRFATISAQPTNTTAGTEAGVIRFYTKDTGDSNIIERMRIQAGGGISFNGDTAAANALDDYEEGSYTVTLTPSTSGSITLSTSERLASYIKIGNFVSVTGRVTVSSVSSPSGELQVNLPFTVSNAVGQKAHSTAPSVFVWSSTASNLGLWSGFADNTYNYFSLRYGTGNTPPPSSNYMQAGTEIRFSFQYYAA